MKSKILGLLAVGIFFGSLVVGTANAGVVFTISQNASGVTITGSGSYDLTGASLLGSGSQDGYINSSLGLAVGGPFSSVWVYALTTNPGAYGSGGFVDGAPDVGDVFGLDIVNAGGFLTVPTGYAGGALSGSTFFSGGTFASLGLVVGSWVYRVPNDTLSVNVVPEPGSLALLSLGLLSLGMSRRKA